MTYVMRDAVRKGQPGDGNPCNLVGLRREGTRMAVLTPENAPESAYASTVSQSFKGCERETRVPGSSPLCSARCVWMAGAF